MTYLVIFNGRKYGEEIIRARTWIEFSRELMRLVEIYQQPPDMIYLKEIS